MPKKRKKPGTRQIEKRLIIVCEGAKDKSESAYFKSLIKSYTFAGNKVEVKVIDTTINSGKELVKFAKEQKDFTDIDVSWVVYDKDGYTKHPETFNNARQSNIKIAFSSISFETWILLHFEYTAKAFVKSEDIISYLNKKNYIQYSKGSQDIFNKTKHLLSTAKSHSVQLQKYQKHSNSIDTQIYEMNPYTNINELITEIENFQKIK